MENQSLYPRPLSQLTHLSASSISGFMTCPHSWAASQLYGIKSPMNKYAAIGKTVHSVVEDHVMKRKVERDISLLPPAEVDNLIRYRDEKVLNKSKQVISVEYEFKMPWTTEGVPPLYGFMDMVDVTDDGALRVTDHKTNRAFESIDEWKKKIQPPLYLYVAKRIWPQFNRHVFRLGYVNIDIEPLEWDWTPEMDAQLHTDLAAAWNAMVFFSTSLGTSWGELSPLEGFPQRVHEYCGGCPLKDSCATFRHTTSSLIESLPFVQITDEEKYIRLKAAKKALDSSMDELAEKIQAKVESNNGIFVSMGHKFTMEAKTTRIVEAKELLDTLNKAVDEFGPEAAKLVAFYFEDIFTGKVGGLDKLFKEAPPFHKFIDPIIKKRVSSPSLSMKKL